MLRSIAILLLSLVASFAVDAKTQREQFRVRAQVQDIVALSSFSGSVLPIGSDPRFAVTLRIESVTPADTNFTPGSAVTFAVHSPSRLFAATDAKGKTYDFVVRRATVDGKTRISDLEVRR
jgi:hypothetical protein